MNMNSRHRNTGAQAKARTLLEFALTDEWQPSLPLKRRVVETLGCHPRAVYRAAEELGVERRRTGSTTSDWRLPRAGSSTQAPAPEVDHAGHVA